MSELQKIFEFEGRRVRTVADEKGMTHLATPGGVNESFTPNSECLLWEK